MKHRLTILLCSISLLFIISCEAPSVELGAEVRSVVYGITDNDSVKDANNYNNSNVTTISEATASSRNTSPVKPIRKGYDFSKWINSADPSRTYVAGGVFSKFDANENIKLTSEFKPNTSKYFTPKKMFTISASELGELGLGEHINARAYNPTTDTGFAPKNPIDVNFVSLPGGYIHPIINVVDNYNGLNAVNFYLAMVGLNKGNSNDKNTWVVEDYALSETEVSSGLFKLIETWNKENNKGYEFGFDRSAKIDPSYDDYPYYGAYYDANGIPKNRKSAYDPVCNLPWDSAVVFCNALTEWYNEKYNANLTYAYTNTGTNFGSPIKSVKDDSKFLASIETRDTMDDNKTKLPTSDGYYPLSHVQGATGFRLPTTAEWLFAATIEPDVSKNISDNIKLSGYTYPNVMAYNITSGRTTDDPSDAYYYAITSNIYGKGTSTDSGSEIVGSKSIKTPLSASKNSKNSANSIGLYDMSGNVKEYTETLVIENGKNVTSRVAFGGGFDNTVEQCVPSYAYSNSYKDNIMYDGNRRFDTKNRFEISSVSYGFRLARTISSEPYKY